MRQRDVDLLDPKGTYWVASVLAPCCDWSAAPGCYEGERFLIDRHGLTVTRHEFAAFASKLSCLRWMMRHRDELNLAFPGAKVDPVRLDRWLLGLE